MGDEADSEDEDEDEDDAESERCEQSSTSANQTAWSPTHAVLECSSRQCSRHRARGMASAGADAKVEDGGAEVVRSLAELDVADVDFAVDLDALDETAAASRKSLWATQHGCETK